MNKKILLLLCCMVLGILCVSAAPKREMRATWLTAVANIDWPMSSTKTVEAQQAELLELLDVCVETNMNTVLLHIRPACDALYKSKYEPWSSYLNHGRGVDPGYDPLQFCIDECHKRGLTCHGWINPYRYGKRGGYDWTGNDDTTQLNYKHTHPEWLLYYKNDIYLDPAQPEVRQRIKEVVGDIINNYDVDGILMDDYFYPYGGTTNQDAASVAKYKPADMNVGDWRRQNVNMMIKDVYDTIQAVKPWVTFGVSPFGIWTTDSNVARKRGIRLPSGISGGNMYAEIYCDPVAWLEEGTVDYISPQLYWKVGGGQDYKRLSRWWAELCNRFGKHFYSSMALYKYEEGATGFAINDIRQQLVYNRVVTDNAPGAVFYNTRAWAEYNAKKLRVNLTKNEAEFQYIALPPAINWKPAKERVMVENLALNGQTLSWTHMDNDVHFAVYAATTDSVGTFSIGETLIGVSYTTSFELPAGINPQDYRIGVSVLDKYNNEFALRILGEELLTPQAPKLVYPRDGYPCKLPIVFEWQVVEKADSYIIQIARDEQMQDLLAVQEVVTTTFSTDLRINLQQLPLGNYYWRVKARIPNAGDTWSPVRRVEFALEDAVDNIEVTIPECKKYVENGLLLIEREGRIYNLLGNEIITK